MSNISETELLIIGGGLAGISAALTAQKFLKNITLVTKGKLFKSGSTFVNINRKLGISYGVDDTEKNELLERVTILSCGTNNANLSEILIENAYSAFLDLLSMGVGFEKDDTAAIRRVCPCFHSFPRASIISSTAQLAACFSPRLERTVVTVLENNPVRSIQKTDDRSFRCLFGNDKFGFSEIIARSVLLASGGNSAIRTPNIVESGLEGDGYEMLNQLGVRLKNMEYHQLVWEDVDIPAKRFPLQALFDKRFTVTDYQGKKIELEKIDRPLIDDRKSHVPISNLQPDRCFDELLMKSLPSLKRNHALVLKDSKGAIVSRFLPFYQANNGGIEIGENGETGIDGLYAAGEIATGMHGGDRIGGMMVASALVFSKRAALHACENLV